MTISQERVKELLQYIGGELFWLPESGKDNSEFCAGYINGHGYRVIKIDGKLYQCHRLVFLYHNGYIPKYIDHINRNKLDNSIDNLRGCTISQNGCNRLKQKNNSTGVKGVYWREDRQKYQAEIQINGKANYLGLFYDLKDADEAVKKARKSLHGEFANNGEDRIPHVKFDGMMEELARMAKVK